MADLFIPKRIKVGYQKRDDTYTKKLAYVIYYDAKGVLRKETSWENWRHKNIAAEEFDNVPHGGFILNKGHTRYSWSHFGSNRTVIRIYDDRGIEFEITPENLVGLLMETNCSKRAIEGELVYAWAGTELLLLPTSSEEYKKAVEYTALQESTVSAKDLKAGCSYTTKKQEEVIYIGRYPWFEWGGYGNKSNRVSKKAHIFARPEKPKYGDQFFPKSSADFLATLNSPDPVANYADLIDAFKGNIHSSVIVGWETKPVANPDLETKKEVDYYGRAVLKRTQYAKVDGDNIDFYHLSAEHQQGSWDKATNKYSYNLLGYRLTKQGSINTKTLVRTPNENRYDYGYGYNYHNSFDYRNKTYLSDVDMLKELEKMVDVYIVLESGKKVRIKDYDEYRDK